MKTSIITLEQRRFTAISDRLVRIEYDPQGLFSDESTLSVSERPQAKGYFHVTHDGPWQVLDTGAVRIRSRLGAGLPTRQTLTIEFVNGESPGRWVPGQRDRGNLHGAKRTVDSHHGNMLWDGSTMVDAGDQPGLCSRDGWVLHDDSSSPLLLPHAGVPGGRWPQARRDGIRDWYLFCHGDDYPAALADGARLFGRQPLVPRWALGYWWSRWWAYSDVELEALVAEFDRFDLPLDVLVLDMEWHRPGWSSSDWERDLFSDPRAFCRRIHQRGLKIAANLHPAGGITRAEAAFPAAAADTNTPLSAERIAFDCSNADYMKAWFRHGLHPREDDGIDLWWLDWQQGTDSGMAGLDPLPWQNHLHWHDQVERAPGKRPLGFSRYGGHGAGRTPMGFSGDIESSWRSLAYLLRLTAESANSLFGYWSHDTGGFFASPWEGPTSSELYTRWVQATVRQSIFRTHCGRDADGDRRFWLWGEPHGSIMMEALRQRYALVPYIASECRYSYDHHISLCHPLYYRWPRHDQAYRHPQQYGFGRQMIVAPVTEAAAADGLATVRLWLPPGQWIETASGQYLDGGDDGRRLSRRFALAEVPTLVRPGAIIPGQGPVRRLAAGAYPALAITVYPGGNDRYEMDEDDGESTDYQKRHGHATLPLAVRASQRGLRITLDTQRGQFSGQVQQRPVTLRLPHTLPPAMVTVDGVTLADSSWHWDAASLSTIIDLATVDHRRRSVISVRWRRGAEPPHAAGLSGALQRCQLAFAGLRASCHELCRPVGRLAHTAHRIAANPATINSELAALRADLPQLRKACIAAKAQVPAAAKRSEAMLSALSNAGSLLRAAEKLLLPLA